jgi:hypothetical protein
MSELSLNELEAQHGELLPEREALGRFSLNVGSFDHDHNQSVTINQNDSTTTKDSLFVKNVDVNNSTILINN